MSCIICSTIFKNEGFLKKSFDNLKLLKPLFTKIKVVVSYDNSGDKSLLELIELKKEGWDIEILMNNKPRFRSHIGRAFNIAQARNQILNYIYSNDELSKYNYFIMADLDDVFNFKIYPEILNKYLSKSNILKEWDSLAFYNKGFYDTWSVSIDEFQESGWIPTENIDKCWDNQRKIRDHLNKVVEEMNDNDIDMCKIDSIFNGFCIHKLNQFKDIRYKPVSLLNNEIFIDCEHRSFYKEGNNHGLKIMFSKDCLFEEMTNINELNNKNKK
jgi:hypothetical protein